MHELTIFRLKHVKGIGNIGRLKLLNYLLEHEEYMLEELCHISGVKRQYIDIFIESFKESQKITNYDLEIFKESYGFLTILDEGYPIQLAEIYNPPIALFYKGNTEFLKTKMLAVIGSRQQTDFGKQMIENIVPKVVEQSISIVSGLAKGNDTYAHKLAIRSQGNTVGVLGFGLDRVYPKENTRLQDYMCEHQLVITEYLPKESPLPYHFPERNRIISGLSDGTLVIEAKRKSGTFITAQLALEEGRSVFAIPNNPLNKTSEGCLSLIQEGAKCTVNYLDILQEL